MCSKIQYPSSFVAIDGDDVGVTLETLILRDCLADVRVLSQRITTVVAEIAVRLEAMGAQIVFVGGDSILAELPVPDADLAWLHDLPASPCTFSAGVGHNAMTAYLALRVAKGLGKRRTIHFASLVSNTSRSE